MALPASEQPLGGPQLRFLLFLLLLLLLLSWPAPGDALVVSESGPHAHELRGRFQDLLNRLRANQSLQNSNSELARDPAVRVLTPEGEWPQETYSSYTQLCQWASVSPGVTSGVVSSPVG